MADVTAQVILAMDSGMTEDYASNTWHFTGIDEDVDLPALTEDIGQFYSEIRSYLSGDISETGNLVKWYLTGAPKPNYPVAEISWDFGGVVTNDPLPSEVSLCLSFEGVRISGQPQSRRRGRLYIGPLSTIGNSAGRPSAAMRTDFLDAAATFASKVNGVPAISTGFWGVWSPTDQAFTPAKTAWVDDAFDTQRRRGVQPTVKDTVTFPLPTV